MSSTSDHDMSESSYLGSPQSYLTESPYSSPSQQVPQLATILTELSCAEYKQHRYSNNGNAAPTLRIVEQPQNHFRFRYVSEMVGTHGCLLGKSYATNKTKTHPTVELVNYAGQALIRCRLSQHNNPEEHPHKLLEDEQDRDVSYMVPEHGSYKVGFAGMGIIHTAKKDVPGLLFKKMAEKFKNSVNMKEIKTQCENIAKNINLNIVRLRFSAHDMDTGKEICDPVFSEPIHNMKSAATNDLKICRISRCSGRPRGGDDVFVLVEKVNKKNIMIRFYELSPNGDVTWSATGNFLHSDVHHQYAIVFRTPPYKDPQIGSDVTVYIELVRPSDGRTSEPKEFTYKAEQVYKQIKKRKMTSPYSSLGSSSGGSIKSLSEIPTMVASMNQQPDEKIEVPSFTIQRLPVVPHEISSPAQCDLANALGLAPGMQPSEQPSASPMWGQPNVVPVPMTSQFPNLKLNSSEFEKMLKLDTDMPPEERKMLSEADWLLEYLRSHGDSIPEENNSMDFIRSTLVPDSARAKGPTLKADSPSTSRHVKSTYENVDIKKEVIEYTAVYKSEDGLEVKKLVNELCEIIKNKKGYKKHEVRSRLEKLFEIRLSNGDRFLHMTLCSKQPSFEYIVKMINSVKMTHLLDLTNYKQQTILHLAVMNDLPDMVNLLVSKGCNPMVKDHNDNNAIHYAVRYQSCLLPLLSAIKKYGVVCDLNASNNEKQSPLHVAAVHDCGASARALLAAGASYSVRDTRARTPLHLAAYDDKLRAAQALLEYVTPTDIDAVDDGGNTALQIVCGGAMRENTRQIVKLLLEKKADPSKHGNNNKSAWKLVSDKPALRDVMSKYVNQETMYEDDVKSEPDDDFESADEGEVESPEGSEEAPECGGRGGGGLEVSEFAREVAALVDAGGAWRDLARRLQLGALLSWFGNQPSPTLTLLNNLKECNNDITSKSLAMILEEMGQHEAAQIIRRYID